MEERTHGGDIYGLERPVLDLSISLNPLGVPPCAIQAAREALERSPAYPDPLCRGLRQAISARDGVPEDWVLCGNGASDLIDRLVRALRPDHALVLAPTFSEYHRALHKNNCKVKFHYANMHEDFRFSSALLGKISQEIDAVFLCDPNNPTGTLISPQLLRALLARCREAGALLVVDQCFLELSPGEPDRLVRELEGGGLLLLRALTKSYAMAGLRLGYCLSDDRALLAAMAEEGPPWPVSQLAQQAGISALQYAPDWPFRVHQQLEEERRYLSQELSRLRFHVYPSDSNFLLFQGEEGWRERLLDRGILIRSCADFQGLGPGFYRVCVRSRGENKRLIQAIQQEREAFHG